LLFFLSQAPAQRDEHASRGGVVLDLSEVWCYVFLMRQPFDHIPDVRDGLTREERIVLYVLHETQKERGERNVPTAMLWGRVCEHFYISPEDLSLMLARMGARK
jgi:hypothetical protein